MEQIWAENAVIRKETDTAVEYSARCPSCGHVSSGRTIGGTAGLNRAGHRRACRCEKCRNDFYIVIGRG